MDEVEKLAKEQIEADKAKAVEEATAETKKKLEEAEAELAKLKDKDFNFSKVRKGEEEKGKEVEELKKQIGDLNSRITGEHKTDLLKVLAGDDEDLKKSIEHHYDRIKDDAQTKEQIEAKMREAYHLATRGSSSPDPLKATQSAASGIVHKANAGEVDPEVAKWGKAFGLSEDDIKKHNK